MKNILAAVIGITLAALIFVVGGAAGLWNGPI